MKNQIMLKRKALSASIAAVMLGGMTVNAFADDNTIDEVVVTGIKASLTRAMDIKRDAAGVVDAISSEDMGKMPDTNLAESLQRITGISIDRNSGEGSKVTARGFGSQYNLVTLNGRQMPTASGDDRSFDFAAIASEGVNGVQVYKTAKAEQPAGGIGATINIQTLRPLDKPGFMSSIGLKYVHDTSANSSDNANQVEQPMSLSGTPEFSGIISDTFNDDKIGVLVSASVQKRESGYDRAYVAGWRTHYGDWDKDNWGGGKADWTALVNDANQINRPQGPKTNYSIPQVLGYEFDQQQRTRKNGQLVFQFKSTDTFTSTLDYTYTQLDIATQYSQTSAWFNFGGQHSSWNKTSASNPIGSPYYIYEDNWAGAPQDVAFGAGDFATEQKSGSLGYNAKWDVSDNFKLELDAHHSIANSSPNSPYGSGNTVGFASYTRQFTKADFSQDFPVLSLGITPGKTIQDEITPTGSIFDNEHSKMTLDQTQVKGQYTFDDSVMKSVNFGVSAMDLYNHHSNGHIQHDTWGGVDSAYQNKQNPAYNGLFNLSSFADRFGSVISGGDSIYMQRQYMTTNFGSLVAALNSISPHKGTGANGGGDCGFGYCPTSDLSTGYDRFTEEKTNAAFVQGNLKTEVIGMPLNASLGVRYETTDVTSTALVPNFNGGLIVWSSGNELALPQSKGVLYTKDTGSYNEVLPSLDVDLEVIENLKVRLSGSKTIARAGFGDLQGGLTVGAPVRIDYGSGGLGNANLKPLESKNFDISTEWYFGDASYISVGYFHKDVSNFIGHGTRVVNAFNMISPSYGPLMTAARAALGNAATPGDLYAWIVANKQGQPGVNGGTITAVPGRDGVEPFKVDSPINQHKAMLQGEEFAIQHTFDFGLGAQLNYTKVSGDVHFDDFLVGIEQFALLGLSDSANAVVFYEKDGWHARVAYNWRDRFLAGTGQANVGGNNPYYVDAYAQVDANVSYDVDDKLTLMVEGINLTNSYKRTSGRSEAQPLDIYISGPRYDIGLRYKF